MVSIYTDRYLTVLCLDRWKALKRQAIAVSGRCARCGETRKQFFELHHLHYKTRGRETLDDVKLLCGYCHNQVHRFLEMQAAGDLWRKLLRAAERKVIKECGLPWDLDKVPVDIFLQFPVLREWWCVPSDMKSRVTVAEVCEAVGRRAAVELEARTGRNGRIHFKARAVKHVFEKMVSDWTDLILGYPSKGHDSSIISKILSDGCGHMLRYVPRAKRGK